MDPTQLNLEKLKELIPDQGAAWLTANRLFYQGDHWQQGNGWSGPLLDSTHALYSQTLLEIQRAFVSKNVVEEITSRHSGAIIGREPAWSLTVRRPLAEGEQPTTAEETLIDEAESLLTDWWDGRKIHKLIQDTTATLLWSRRGLLRLFVPPAQVGEDGLIPTTDLLTSIDRIYLDIPDPEQATVHIDRSTMQATGIYLYRSGETELAEIVYLDDQGQTVLQIVGQAESDQTTIPTFPLQLSGNLTIFEMERPRLVTDQVTQNQKLVNLALTMMQRNVIQGGFLERTFLNTQLPGQEIPDPNRPGETKFQPEPFYTGPGATNFLTGIPIENVDGTISLATPSVVYRDPVGVDVFKTTKQAAYENILEEVGQLHAVLSGDAVASGESRKQALTDFRDSLKDTKTELEAALRWLLETVLAMTAQFAGQPGRYDGLRAVAECHLDLGPASADDQRVAKEMVEAGIISKQTARGRIGIDDPDAEAQQIETEQDADSQRQQQTLAAAVLNAQRQAAGGGGSNGLEQPV